MRLASSRCAPARAVFCAAAAAAAGAAARCAGVSGELVRRGALSSEVAVRRSRPATLSGAIASTSMPSAHGLVESTTASTPKAWRTSARASRDVRAAKRLTFMRYLR